VRVKVRDLPPDRLLSVDPSTKLSDLAREMRTNDSDSVAVMDDGRLVGIITERDLVRAIADGLNPKEATAAVVMTVDPATVTADEDVSVVAVKMMRLGIRHLPVVNDKDEPVGLVSSRSLVGLLDRS
jgi:CBS domain-containing protein